MVKVNSTISNCGYKLLCISSWSSIRQPYIGSATNFMITAHAGLLITHKFRKELAHSESHSRGQGVYLSFLGYIHILTKLKVR